MVSRKYPELNDREWLSRRYEDEGLSVSQIAGLIGVKQPASVREALVKHGIPRRNKRQGMLRRLEGDGKRGEDGFVIDGSTLVGTLLGDASLKMHSDNSSEVGAPSFSVTHKDRGHIEYVSGLLFPTNPANRIYERRYKSSLGRVYYDLASLTHERLILWYKEWYPESSGHKKVVPSSIILDETSLLHWFMDDGCSRRYGARSVSVIFASESFVKSDQEMLCEQMNGRWELGAYPVKSNGGTGWRICIPQPRTMLFYDVIGPPPFESIAYKWKECSPLFAHPQLRDPQWLFERWVTDGMSYQEIGELLGAAPSLVSYYVNKLRTDDWEKRVPHQRKCKYPQMWDPEWLYQKHIVEGLSAATISRMLGCPRDNQIYPAIRRFRRTVWLGRPGA